MQLLSSLLPKTLLTTGAALAVFALTASATQAQVLYRQTYGTTSNNSSFSNVGWTVATGATATNYTSTFNTADGLGGWLNNSGGTPQNLPNVNTGGTSASESLGLAVVSLTNSSNRLGMLYTTQFSLNPADYAGLTFSWNQGNASTNIAYRVAIQIGGSWYASSQSFANTTAVGSVANFATQSEAKSFAFSNLAASWLALDFTLGSELELGSALSSNLPTGNITGFGIYMASSSGATARMDTFTITAVPEPTTSAMLLLGAAGSLLISRKRRA